VVIQGIGNDPTTAVQGLQNQELGVIYPQPQLDLVDQVQALEPNVTSKITFGLSFEHLDFNTSDPNLADPNVRKAFAMALDRQEVVDQTVGQFSSDAQVLDNRMYVNNQPQYRDNAPAQYQAQDVAGAKALLEKSGYELGADGIYAKGGKKLSFRFSTTAGNKLRETQGELFQAQMKDVGIEIKIANVDSTKFFGDWLPNGNFDIANFDHPVLIAGLAGNRDIYRTGFGKPLDEVGATWVKALAAPIAPRVVEQAPCQEVVI